MSPLMRSAQHTLHKSVWIGSGIPAGHGGSQGKSETDGGPADRRAVDLDRHAAESLKTPQQIDARFQPHWQHCGPSACLPSCSCDTPALSSSLSSPSDLPVLPTSTIWSPVHRRAQLSSNPHPSHLSLAPRCLRCLQEDRAQTERCTFRRRRIPSSSLMGDRHGVQHSSHIAPCN